MTFQTNSSLEGRYETILECDTDACLPQCIDSDRRGNCLLPAGQSCGLREFFPEIVQTVTSLNSDSFDDYVSALRSNVCSHCGEQGADGVCRRRESVECALDRYFGLVIQVIDETEARALVPAS